jgi:hypothetical protein
MLYELLFMLMNLLYNLFHIVVLLFNLYIANMNHDDDNNIAQNELHNGINKMNE